MRWAVILAGGNGSRLQSLTRAMTGDDRPKQFCPLLGAKTLLAQTRSRVALNVNTTRSLCVVTRDHERYYRHELSDLRPAQIVEQPSNRGTGAAIAYSIARIARDDKKAVIGLFPADHHYEDVETFRRTVDRAYVASLQRPDLVFLLATEPDSAEVEYGWIEPGDPVAGLESEIFHVSRFWEKPSRDTAEDLLTRSCLWNMFVMIGSLGAFRTLLYSSFPDMMRQFELIEQFPSAERDTVERVYSALPPVDFSKDVLARHTRKVAVARVPNVGWTDLGQPARVHSFLSAHGASLAALRAVS
jgi:mannose-1-phosphate guanylyltransferase